MSLTYKNGTYGYNGEYEMSSVNKFAQAERRLSAKKQALDDMKNEYDLIEQQHFALIKKISSICYSIRHLQLKCVENG